MSEAVNRETFAGWVKSALHQIYDSPYLQTNTLAGLLADPEMETLQRGQNLRRILLDAISAMRPEAGQPAGSANWRAYQILELRYVEGLAPPEIMRQLAISRSYYFHEHGRMLNAIVALLWDRYAARLSQAAPTPPSPLPSPSAPHPAPAVVEPTQDVDRDVDQDVDQEFDRMVDHAVWESVDIPRLIDQLRPVLEPMLSARGARLVSECSGGSLTVSADRMLLRQALLSAVSYAANNLGQGDVALRCAVEDDELVVSVRFKAQAAPSAQAEGTLETCRRIVTRLAGAFDVREIGSDAWDLRLSWRADAQRTLLMVDDNQELINLVRRYLTPHGWQVVGATSGAAARQVLQDRQPTVVLLDIMMPQEDGWELLMALKSSAATQDLPVIVCSVLAEEALALSLGAHGFVQKPISQQPLLKALATLNSGVAGPAQTH